MTEAFRAFFQSILVVFIRLRALMRKEATTLLLDPGVRRILVVPILAQSVLFGYGATFNLEQVPYVIHDASRSPESEALVRAIAGNGIFREAKIVMSAQALREAIDHGDALLGISIPTDFADRLARGEEAPVMVSADARNTTTANVATGYMSAIIAARNAARSGSPGALVVEERYRYNENNITRYNIMTGLILGLSMIQVMLLAGLAVSREREEGSFDMMLMTPLTPVEIFIGKAVPPILIGVFQGFLIFSVCRWWFEIPFAGSTALLFGVVTLFASSIVGLALAVSAFSSTLQQSVVFNFIILLPSLILSGLMTPVAAMPLWLQTATILNPVRYGITVVRMIYFENAGPADILPFLWPMALISAVTLPTAVWLFRHKVS
mgnify:CR=1 FL=1